MGYRGSVDCRKKYVSVIDGWNSLNYALSTLENDFDVSDYVGVADETQAHIIREERPIVVHARLGDYANYRKGRYFFGANFYVRLATELARAEPIKKVVICTDEPAEFTELPYLLEPDKVCLSKAKSLIEDLQIMSSACWIVGPPSSVSMLASSIGKVPLSWIFSAEDSIEKLRKNRSKVVGFYRFENGKVLTEGLEGSLLLESGTVPRLRPFFQLNDGIRLHIVVHSRTVALRGK